MDKDHREKHAQFVRPTIAQFGLRPLVAGLSITVSNKAEAFPATRRGVNRIQSDNEADTFDNFNYGQFGISSEILTLSVIPGAPPSFAPSGSRIITACSCCNAANNQGFSDGGSTNSFNNIRPKMWHLNRRLSTNDVPRRANKTHPTIDWFAQPLPSYRRFLSTFTMTTIQQGHIIALFAFDVGYEVDLDKLRELLTTTPVQPLSRKKQTPTYLQYSKPPHLLHLGATPALLARPGDIQATIYDFGCVSIAYRWPIGEPLAFERLPALSQDLYERNLEHHARELIESLRQRMAPAITRPALSKLVEDFFLFVVEKLDTHPSAEALLAEQGAAIAQTLRFESKPLAPVAQAEALTHWLSYYTDDLVVLDWNAAVIYDADYEDIFNVLELLNVELLEARYIDAQLDRQLEQYAQLVRRPKEKALPLRNPYRLAMQDLAELRIEAALLTERVENTLKLIGNLYLARLHELGAQRFKLQEWDQQIKQKLDLASEFYQLLNDRVQIAQSHALEWIVIILILVEVVMGFLRH